ncbi:hypothetical protein H9660_03660 [Clostridium sp. Sa3CUN1]|uniref:Uncharacterized protein n=1 Tax=Clostridium gallinarum TaxID=2762246 RepID=A0ABR8Q1E9_9CLOT|nr:hypothetical protein [Clostridium gallinarum]MBD7914235.1 hypothetical protein [Clostridium gallinarum]
MINIEPDIKICRNILEEYKKMTSTENPEVAFKLSQLALGMYDRLNEIRLYVSKADKKDLGKYTKSDLKEYLRSKMKAMEYVHIESKHIFLTVKEDKKLIRY